MCSSPQHIRHWAATKARSSEPAPDLARSSSAVQTSEQSSSGVQELRKIKSPPKESRTLLKRKLEFTERRGKHKRHKFDGSNSSMPAVVRESPRVRRPINGHE